MKGGIGRTALTTQLLALGFSGVEVSIMFTKPATKINASKDSQFSSSDWICPACGNNNFSKRLECFMRNCSQPRPKTVQDHDTFTLPSTMTIAPWLAEDTTTAKKASTKDNKKPQVEPPWLKKQTDSKLDVPVAKSEPAKKEEPK